ncbi:MAG: transglutaminase family protein [Candidatus Dormibacteraeota bacterium]|uniref:Transglutaminase family protein n=1 Tax=Candidatus Aeolococcus gillhamiae TaxID=3127015 RepID=A0A934N4U1_9BACT|nr:transglutaminase family protein [Candidatus Dormibacteraeota bacterium]
MPEDSRRQVRVGCEFVHDLSWPVTLVLQVEPRPDAVLAITRPQLQTEPAVPMQTYADIYGNVCRRLTLRPGRTHIRYEAEVEVDAGVDEDDPSAALTAVADLPAEVLHYTLASRYCESDRLSNTAWALFGAIPEGWERVRAVVDWVHNNITFAMGSSDTSTGATHIYVQRRGVCRDFTHLAVAFLRSLNVPTRYCFGYLPDIDVMPVPEPMDFAAWLEAYIGDRWYTFDPRNNERRTGRVVVGRGRDAADVAMLTSYGRAPLAAMRVAAEPAGATPWSSADPPVRGVFEDES